MKRCLLQSGNAVYCVLLALCIILMSGCGGGFDNDSADAPGYQHLIFGTDTIATP